MPAPEALSQARVVLCSACLLGFGCRYDGADKRKSQVADALAGKEIVPICPEVAGGLPAPRPPADFVDGDGAAVLERGARLRSSLGDDVTEAFLHGARLALEAAQRYGASVAVLKEGSPSCGIHRVTVGGASVAGLGVAAAALRHAGLVLVSDEEL
ncbi:MAG: DUF523 domain-containing protein [Deltaproteobacteria bacterium]|nr:DUF523 domain-containing protein [Deltaproteobacteria bacterium]